MDAASSPLKELNKAVARCSADLLEHPPISRGYAESVKNQLKLLMTRIDACVVDTDKKKEEEEKNLTLGEIIDRLLALEKRVEKMEWINQ